MVRCWLFVMLLYASTVHGGLVIFEEKDGVIEFEGHLFEVRFIHSDECPCGLGENFLREIDWEESYELTDASR
jgi:hypothetical protein